MVNQFVYFEAPGEPSLYARVAEIEPKRRADTRDYSPGKNAVWGVGNAQTASKTLP